MLDATAIATIAMVKTALYVLDRLKRDLGAYSPSSVWKQNSPNSKSNLEGSAPLVSVLCLESAH